MARTRSIKPSFFVNEDLAKCQVSARLLFIGLWCLADCEGKLEDRPQKIKAELFPYENVDVEKSLNELQRRGFIVRYKHGNRKELRRFILIVNFKRHQNPHPDEKAKGYPDPLSIPREKIAGQFSTAAKNALTLDPSSLPLAPLTTTTEAGQDNVVVVKNRLLKALEEQKLAQDAARRYVESLDPDCIRLILEAFQEMVEAGSLTVNPPGQLNKMLANPEGFLDRVDGTWQRRLVVARREPAGKPRSGIDEAFNSFKDKHR